MMVLFASTTTSPHGSCFEGASNAPSPTKHRLPKARSAGLLKSNQSELGSELRQSAAFDTNGDAFYNKNISSASLQLWNRKASIYSWSSDSSALEFSVKSQCSSPTKSFKHGDYQQKLPILSRCDLISETEEGKSLDGKDGDACEKKEKPPVCQGLGLIYAGLAALCFSLTAFVVRHAETPPAQLVAVRGVLQIVFLLPTAIKHRHDGPFLGKNKWQSASLFLRGFAGAVLATCSFYAYDRIPLADATVIIYSCPVFVSVLACMFLNEPCGTSEIITVILTVTGVILAAKPPFIFHFFEDKTEEVIHGEGLRMFDSTLPFHPHHEYHNLNFSAQALTMTMMNQSHPEFNSTVLNCTHPLATTTPEYDLVGYSCAFGATLCTAFVSILLRSLRSMHYTVPVLWLSGFQIVVGGAMMVMMHEYRMPHNSLEVVYNLAIGVLCLGSQVFLTMALQLENALPVTLIQTSQIVLSFLYQVTVLYEHPPWISYLGAILVTSGVVTAAVKRWRTERKKRREAVQNTNDACRLKLLQDK